MEPLIILLVLLLAITCILPWILLATQSGLRTEIKRLKSEIRDLKESYRSLQQPSPPRQEMEVEKMEASPNSPAHISEVPASKSHQQDQSPIPKASTAQVTPPPLPAGHSVPESARPVATSIGKPVSESNETTGIPVDREIEPDTATHHWFSKAAVWIGGVALLMAGFFMIKYSIDSGWLTPAVRIWLTTTFGVALCVAGHLVTLKTTIRANKRIGQSLAGAGIGCLYFAVYASVHLFEFLTWLEGFGSMVAVTLLAVVLSLKHGAPIALMGMIGGYVTPALMKAEALDTRLLFGYLILMLVGTQILCLRRGWPILSLLSLLCVYAWSAGLILTHAISGSSIQGAMFFLMGVCALNAAMVTVVSRRDPSKEPTRPTPKQAVYNFIVWMGGILQALAIVWLGNFDTMDIAAFSVISLGALALGTLNEGDFPWAASVGLIAVQLVALINSSNAIISWFVCPTFLALVFFGVCHWKGLHSKARRRWIGISMASLAALPLILYCNRAIRFSTDEVPIEIFWLLLAVGCGVLLVLAGEHLLFRTKSLKLAGAHNAVAVFLLVFGLWEFLPLKYLPHAVALILFASMSYWNARNLALRPVVTTALTSLWSVLMIPSTVAALFYFYYGEGSTSFRMTTQTPLILLSWALGISWGLPAIRRTRDSERSAFGCWTCAAFLVAIVVFFQWADGQVIPDTIRNSVVSGVLTTVFAWIAIVFRILAFRWRPGRAVAAVAAALTGVRILFLHLGGYGAAGDSFFFNALLWQFGIPFGAAFALAWISASETSQLERRSYQVAAMVLGFVWSTFLVQDYFGGGASHRRQHF